IPEILSDGQLVVLGRQQLVDQLRDLTVVGVQPGAEIILRRAVGQRLPQIFLHLVEHEHLRLGCSGRMSHSRRRAAIRWPTTWTALAYLSGSNVRARSESSRSHSVSKPRARNHSGNASGAQPNRNG